MKLPSPDKDWFVVRCRPRSEHIAAEELRLGGFETYLPMRRKKNFLRRWRLVVNHHVPAMPGYVFLATEWHRGVDWGRLAYHSDFRHVGEPLRGSCGPLLIHASIIIAISVDEMNGALDEVGAHDKLGKRFAAGTQVRIIDGPFASRLAVSEGVAGNDFIDAVMDLFGRQTRVKFEPSQLEVA